MAIHHGFSIYEFFWKDSQLGRLSQGRLRKRLRGFLAVKDQRNCRLVFRYYDPRVLNVYLPTCTADELETVFGPIERFWAENAAADAWQEFRIEGRSLLSEMRSFSASSKS